MLKKEVIFGLVDTQKSAAVQPTVGFEARKSN